MCFGGGDGGLAAMKEQISAEERWREEQRVKEEEARQQQLADETKSEQEFLAQIDNAYQEALQDSYRFFDQNNLDKEAYTSDILEAVDDRKRSVPKGSENIDSYFADLAESLVGDLTNTERGKLLRAFDDFGYEGFARDRISDTSDDDIIESILGEQRGEAETAAQRAFDRRMLTDGGLEAAMKEIADQTLSARSNLQDIGESLLERGRGTLREEVDRGRQRAASFNLGDNFDLGRYRNSVDEQVENFFSGLRDDFAAQTPELFDIDAAFGKGGAAQGAQNTPFSTDTAQGLFASLLEDDENEDDEKDRRRSPLKVF